MKSLSLLLCLLLTALVGCSKRDESSVTNAQGLSNTQKPVLYDSAKTVKSVSKEKGHPDSRQAYNTPVSLEAAVDRKIIRDADLTIEVNSTILAQQEITSIAQTNGGFVVTSEAKQRENSEPAKRTVDIKLVVRVPSNQFNTALQQIEQLGTNTPQRNVNGQDVTEEFIDLEARVKTQKALELQFLEIMKQAHKVEDALEVQRQIADVRTEIEKLEGRKRFLENRSSMSTITVNVRTPVQIVVSASGFGHTIREATADSIDIASGIVLFFVRLVIVMTPVLGLVGLPLSLVVLYFKRRAYRIRLAHELEASPAVD